MIYYNRAKHQAHLHDPIVFNNTIRLLATLCQDEMLKHAISSRVAQQTTEPQLTRVNGYLLTSYRHALVTNGLFRVFDGTMIGHQNSPFETILPSEVAAFVVRPSIFSLADRCSSELVHLIVLSNTPSIQDVSVLAPAYLLNRAHMPTTQKGWNEVAKHAIDIYAREYFQTFGYHRH